MSRDNNLGGKYGVVSIVLVVVVLVGGVEGGDWVE